MSSPLLQCSDGEALLPGLLAHPDLLDGGALERASCRLAASQPDSACELLRFARDGLSKSLPGHHYLWGRLQRLERLSAGAR